MFARKTYRVLMIVALALLFLVAPAQAQGIDPGDIPAALPDAAAWLGSAAVAAAAAFLIQRAGWYRALEPGWFKDFLGALPFWALPALSAGLLRLIGLMTPEQLAGAQGAWNWFLTGLLTWLAWQPARGAMRLYDVASAYLRAQAAWMTRQNELLKRDLERDR